MATHGARRLFTFRSGGWVLALAIVVSLAGTIRMLAPRFAAGRTPPRGDGRTAASYGFDLSTARVPAARIVSSGMTADALPALVDPAHRPPSELPRDYLVSSDKVVGVVLDGTPRAYPLRVLVWHEVVNDVVASVPVAITYNPVSEGIAVFDRRVEGETLTFGVSGLLYQSNLLLYDRRPGSSGESLWSQLQARAIAGPAAAREEALILLPFALCRYGDWIAAWPETTVLAPIAEEARQYGRDVYASYVHTDEIKFPVDPLPPAGVLTRKQRIFAAPSAEGWTITPLTVEDAERRFEIVGPSGTTPVPGLYAYWFAWFATHPEAPGRLVTRPAASSPDRTPSGMPTAPAAPPAR